MKTSNLSSNPCPPEQQKKGGENTRYWSCCCCYEEDEIKRKIYSEKASKATEKELNACLKLNVDVLIMTVVDESASSIANPKSMEGEIQIEKRR